MFVYRSDMNSSCSINTALHPSVLVPKPVRDIHLLLDFAHLRFTCVSFTLTSKKVPQMFLGCS